jgi:murein DD-endopeptidase MepM/ murein hydrolase activator NlpD
MRRRARLTVTLIALVTVGSSFVSTAPRDLALAADPISQARAQQASIERQLADQRARLASLRATSASLEDKLDVAEAQLAQVTAEYERVVQLLGEVRQQVEEITDHLARLRADIDRLDARLAAVAADIARQTEELGIREALLEDHLRSAYEQSQTSLLEVILSADSLDAATNQVGYLLNVSEQDRAIAAEIRNIREELNLKEATLRDGRNALREARVAASAEEAILRERKRQLAELEKRTAELKAAAARKQAEQEAALNAALQAKGNVREEIADNERAFAAASQLVNRLVAEQAALEEARRRQAAEEARRRAEEEARRREGNTSPPSTSPTGFRWPEAAPRITQEWGPTSFALEPPYTYNGVYYPHFHGGIDMASGCGAAVMASKTGVVVASGQPLLPYDTGFGVIIDHGGDVQTWYWHLDPRVVVRPGQVVNGGQLIGYEGTTGFSTGCHLHFAVNDHGVWENPRRYLP